MDTLEHTMQIVNPTHRCQVRLTEFFAKSGVTAEMEKDFVDVSFFVGKEKFIGEIKVTRNLTLSQAFRAAIGQLLNYNDMLIEKASQMVMFLDHFVITSIHSAVPPPARD